MRKTLIVLIGTIAVSAASLGVAQSAGAAGIRYTAPTGTGTACSQASPCSLPEAVNIANDGDTIQMVAEDYELHSPLNITANNLTIAGPAGMMPPGSNIAFLVFDRDPGTPRDVTRVNVFGHNVHFERLGMQGTAMGSSQIVHGDGVTYDRVWIRNFGDSDTLGGGGVTVTNSFIEHHGASTGSAFSASGTITGSTVVSDHGTAILQTPGYMANPRCSTVVRNTLVWGATSTLKLDNAGGSCASIDFDADYSWIPGDASASTGGGWDIGAYVNLIIGSHNLPATPVVFDGSDPSDQYLDTWTLPLNSPAINAGCTAYCSDHDLVGRPRPIGDANDLGHIEQALTPSISAITLGERTGTTAKLAVSINPRGAASTYSIQYRKTGTSGWTTYLDGDITSQLFSASTVDTTLTGLTSNTEYEARVTSRNYRGEATESRVTFRTLEPRVSVSGLKSKLTKKKGKLTSRVTTSDPGKITQIATTKKSGRTKLRCRTTRAAADAGSYPMTCQLSKKTRKELRQKSLKFTVTTTFEVAGGSSATKAKIKVKRKR